MGGRLASWVARECSDSGGLDGDTESDAVGWWLVIFVVGAGLGALQVGAGLLIGRWLAQREAPSADRAEADGEEARQFVLRLSRLASGVADDVGEHRSRMLQANEELSSIRRAEGTDVAEVVLATVAKILQVNERLQDRLIAAEEKLREQARQIECQQQRQTTREEPAAPLSDDQPAVPPAPTGAVEADEPGQPSDGDAEADLDQICEDLRLRLAEVGERPGHV